jgi:hypothetical protein
MRAVAEAHKSHKKMKSVLTAFYCCVENAPKHKGNLRKHRTCWKTVTVQIRRRHTPRVARWFLFKPKIQIWVNFGGSCNGRCWYILCTLGPFYGLFLYFMDIWYSSWKFGIFFPFWYFVRRKIWQPCIRPR